MLENFIPTRDKCLESVDLPIQWRKISDYIKKVRCKSLQIGSESGTSWREVIIKLHFVNMLHE